MVNDCATTDYTLKRGARPATDHEQRSGCRPATMNPTEHVALLERTPGDPGRSPSGVIRGVLDGVGGFSGARRSRRAVRLPRSSDAGDHADDRVHRRYVSGANRDIRGCDATLLRLGAAEPSLRRRAPRDRLDQERTYRSATVRSCRVPCGSDATGSWRGGRQSGGAGTSVVASTPAAASFVAGSLRLARAGSRSR